MSGKPTWVSWIEYLQQNTRHCEPLTLESHDVVGLLKHLNELERQAKELRAIRAELEDVSRRFGSNVETPYLGRMKLFTS
jgi:hypothetical protein